VVVLGERQPVVVGQVWQPHPLPEQVVVEAREVALTLGRRKHHPLMLGHRGWGRAAASGGPSTPAGCSPGVAHQVVEEEGHDLLAVEVEGHAPTQRLGRQAFGGPSKLAGCSPGAVQPSVVGVAVGGGHAHPFLLA